MGGRLVKEPAFFFADEPTSSLDWERGRQVIELLREAAHQRGAAVFLVSHDHRILPYADTVLHIEDGCLLPDQAAAAATRCAGAPVRGSAERFNCST